jgi:hypothetical protein
MDRGVEQGEVGGMEHAVAEPRHDGDGGESCERLGGRDHRERDPDGGEAARQDRPRAEAIDGEARGGLGDAGDAVEDAAQDADVGEGQTRTLAHDQQHGDEGELVVVADAVRDTDQADDAHVAADGNGGGTHESPLYSPDVTRAACKCAARAMICMQPPPPPSRCARTSAHGGRHAC